MAKSSSVPMDRPSRMATRAKNLTARPGLPDVPGWNPDEPDRIPLPPAQRREEAAATKKAVEAAAAHKTAVRDAAVLKAARIEDRKREEDRAADDARRQPKRPKPKPRPRFVKPSMPSGNDNASHATELPVVVGPATTEVATPDGTAHLEGTTGAANTPEVPALHADDVDDTMVGAHDETTADGWAASDQESDVAPEVEVESAASASEFEHDDDDEQQSEDDDEQLTKNTSRRQVKVHRTDVTAARSDAGAPQKRKSVTSSVTLENVDSGKASKKPKVAATPTGLRTGWATPNKLTSESKGKSTAKSIQVSAPRKPATPAALVCKTPTSHAPKSTSKSAPTPIDSHAGTSNFAPHPGDADAIDSADIATTDAGGLNEYGGLQDEDDAAEAAAVTHAPAVTWPIQGLQSESSDSEDDAFPTDNLTHVAHVPAGVVGIVHRPVGQSAANRRRWNTSDLEPEIRQRFTHEFIPLTRTIMSTLLPWYSLTTDERQAVFDRVFPAYDHIIEVNDVVFSLMNNRITEWQGKFAAAALVVLEAHFAKAGMAEPEVRATFCRVQLGTNVAALKAPFLWRVWQDGKKKVERALNVWSTGQRIIPSGHAGHFSADNWGDKTVVSRGVAKCSTKVANMFARAKNISFEHWINILDVARDHHRVHKAVQDRQAITIESASEEVMTDSDAESQ
ncbi:hypothetical protein TRAPUB_2593 [Trametes pubescens]|uniref:Uncharacterized protein n=1 Tax=Trametes pubescens TaxID=154538 RepID=A0A1M2VG26_TRAPU|nr:hypothetical protein TRAPUB_2593 [Trametes pubescens]